MEPTQLPSPHEIARALGGKVTGRNRVMFSPPGHSGRGAEACITVDPASPGGFIVRDFSYSDRAHELALKDYVRERIGLPAWHAGMQPRPLRLSFVRSPDHDRETRQRKHVAQSLVARSLDGKGSLADTYLAARGIRLETWPATIRFLPADPPNHLWPTLLAAYGMPTEPELGVLRMAIADVVGVQLTYLQHDGRGKAPIDPDKRSIGRGHSAPIVLAPLNDGLGLVVAEGIEDALSAHLATGCGAWAAGGAGRMPALAAMVPEFCECVTICADDNAAGRKGAHGLCEGLQARGIEVDVIFLDENGDRK